MNLRKTSLQLLGVAMIAIGLYYATLTPATVFCDGGCIGFGSPPPSAYFPNVFGVAIFLLGVLLTYKSVKKTKI
jgi:hypothetical protein